MTLRYSKIENESTPSDKIINYQIIIVVHYL